MELEKEGRVKECNLVELIPTTIHPYHIIQKLSPRRNGTQQLGQEIVPHIKTRDLQINMLTFH